MSVFFSQTDNSEIIDNSEFYNYYLSLIVNNKENMCAKIAFRGKSEESIVRNISYRGNDGSYKNTTYNEKVEKDVVFIYNCKIEKDSEILVDGSYSTRVDEIIQQAAKKKAEKAFSTKTPVGKQSSFSWMWDDDFNYSKGAAQEITEDAHVAEFTANLLSLDNLNSDDLDTVLKSLKKKFGHKKNDKNEVDVDLYVKTVVENVNRLYHLFFEDKKEEDYVNTMEMVCELLAEYCSGNWVADEIYTALVLKFEEESQIQEDLSWSRQ